MFDHHHHLPRGCCQVIFLAFVAAYYMALIIAWRELLFKTPTSFNLRPWTGYKKGRQMNEIAKRRYRELCSWLTIRHTLMIIGWEDVSVAVSKKCNTFFFFSCGTLNIQFITALFSLFLWRIMERQQRVPSSLGGGCDYLRGATQTDCVVAHCVMLPQICNYSAHCLLQCIGQFICISS